MANSLSLCLVLGLYDNPEKQTQGRYAVDLLENNLAIFGSSMSGKTTLLKTILFRIHQVCENNFEEEIYILDFGSNLNDFGKLPYVVACFDATHEENVRRIFKKIEERFSQNVKKLQGKTFTQCDENNRPAHITFVIDGLNSFMSEDRYNVYHDVLQRLARDGLSKGLSVVFTANESTGGVHRLLPSFKRIAALNMQKDDYAAIFGHRVEQPISIKGRGVANNEDGIFEFQAYLPYNETEKGHTDTVEIEGIKEKLGSEELLGSNKLAELEKKKMKYFADDLTKSNFKDYCQVGPDDLTVGLDYYSMEPIRIDLDRARAIAIYGKKSSGKTNLLSLILEAVAKKGDVRFVILEDGRKGVSDPEKAPSVTKVFNSLKNIEQECFFDCTEFINYIKNKGYYDIPDTLGTKAPLYIPGRGDSSEEKCIFEEKDNPFTVFIVQSNMFYLTVPGGSGVQYIPRLDQFIIDASSENKKLFVFSDVQPIQEGQNQGIFNNWISDAFLLDDIIRFIGNPRGQKSVFGSQDAAELKEQFGKCELGDGFYLNLETRELSKLKFIKQED